MVLRRDHVSEVFKKEAAMTFFASFDGACLGLNILFFGSLESLVDRMIVHAAEGVRREESL